jgi:O-antigen/teichoic acid export membrane protein
MHTSEPATDSLPDSDQQLVLRNSAYLGIAELLVVPVSVVINAFLGHYLGPANLGHVYFATTVCAAAALFISWGHAGPLPAAVALDPASAGKLLGTSLIFRACTAVLAFGVVLGGSFVLGFDVDRRWALALVFLASAIAALTNACQEAIRGFERTDIAAYARVGSQLLAAALVIPVLVAGGGLRITLFVQALGGAVLLAVVMRALRPVGIAMLQWDRAALKKLTHDGTPFVFFQLVLVLQPNVDAFYLAKLAPAEVVGWYAVAQRLVAFLFIPATALVGSLYATLCRLHATDPDGYQRLVRQSLATVSLIVVPVALSCALYPDVGVMIFGRDAYRPAEDTLRMYAIALFLIYFGMPLGTALIAAGRQRSWTVVQLICVANSLLLDPVLIGYFQRRTGNGGTGLPVAAALSETLMVVAGICMLQKGVFDRSLLKSFGLATLSGLCMAVVAFLLGKLTSWSLLTAPVALASYGLSLYWTGAISRDQVAAVRGFLLRKLKRAAA